MKRKLMFIAEISIFISFIIIGVIINTNENRVQQTLANNLEVGFENKKKDKMRFDINIESGNYEYITEDDYKLLNFEEQFRERHKILNVNSKYDTKFSRYIYTKESTYIEVLMNDELIYIKHPVPIDNIKLNNIKMLLEGCSFVIVEPFNDGIYALIYTDAKGFFIMNLETGEKTWESGVSSLDIKYNVYMDTVNYVIDLHFSSEQCAVNKFGEKIHQDVKGSSNGLTIVNIIIIISTIIITVSVIRYIKSEINR